MQNVDYYHSEDEELEFQEVLKEAKKIEMTGFMNILSIQRKMLFPKLKVMVFGAFYTQT